jgi:hypothetical protein
MYLVINLFSHLCHNLKMKKKLLPRGKAIPEMQFKFNFTLLGHLFQECFYPNNDFA